MANEAASVPRLFLQPGDAVFADNPAQVHTVLGSCVALTMRAPRLGVAAVAHCVLPEAGVSASALPLAEALKYVDTTVELMLLALQRRGASVREIEVKIFGGADNLGSVAPSSGYHVGSRNVEATLAALGERGIVPVTSSVGGRHGRVIDFDTVTGEVQVRRLPLRVREASQ